MNHVGFYPVVFLVFAWSFCTAHPRAALAQAKADPARGGTVPTDDAGKPLNLGFETGTLKDWTIEGNAWINQPIEGDAVSQRRPDMQSQHVGRYWLGGFERAEDAPQGVLSSVAFRVTQPWASFLIAGGRTEDTRVEIVDAQNGKILFKATGDEIENMRPVAVDLRQQVGRQIKIRVVDQSSGGWGHVNFDDFRFHEKQPDFPQVTRSAGPDQYAHNGLSPIEAARAMEAPPGFEVRLFAGEPDVQQPIALALDDRGRLWIAEAYSYPIRLPEDKAHDRILIFEDTDHDGHFDKRTVFADHLNLVSGIELGYGGVFVGAAPYLMFIPDRDNDDHADGPPQILLDGWAYQDTHETLNSFMWGPDGWLYGCHGVFTQSNVGKPGTPDAQRQPINAGIWRFHPLRQEFEVFAEGTSNPWGVDFNDRGQAFLTACVIPHLWHVIQNARYERQGGPHQNPFTFEDIKTIAKHRHYVGGNPHGGNGRSDSAGGGHAHAGAMLYLGAAWPDKYRDQIFMNNIHGARINQDQLAPQGSGYAGDRAPDFLLANDTWSQILYLTYGPRGQVYMIDWYDRNQCHHGDVAGHDRSNGRVFEVRYTEAPANAARLPADLAKLSDAELVGLQLQPNDWFVRHARRLLAERAAAGKIKAETAPALEQLAFTHADDTRRLRGLWALHAIGADKPATWLKLLDDASPYVRGWAIQLACEQQAPDAKLLARLANLAEQDPSPIVRLYLASAALRVPLPAAAPIVNALVTHVEDEGDHNLPLMYWYAAERLAAADPEVGFALIKQARVAPVRGYLIRRLAQLRNPQVLERLVAETLGAGVEPAAQVTALREMNTAFQGERHVDLPAGWTDVLTRILRGTDDAARSQAITLATTFGDPQAIVMHRATLLDRQAAAPARLAALAALVKVAPPKLPELLQGLLDDPNVRGAALRALAGYDDAATPGKILAVYGNLEGADKRDALATLAARADYARQLFLAIVDNRVPRSDLSADLVRQLRNLKDKDLDQQIAKIWGAVRDTPADKAETIAQLKSLLSRPAGDVATVADLPNGRAVFAKTCQQCHTLFGTGGRIGPDLTGSNRANLDYLLSNAVDPSAVVQKLYQAHIVTTTNGRVLTGLVAAEDNQSITLVTVNETVVLPRGEIDEDVVSERSMMPDDLLKPLSERDLRSLVAYLASPEQTLLRVRPDMVQALFNGQDLSYWQGEPDLWRVDAGELVGQTAGLSQNRFLRSELLLSDFRLSVEVKLVRNEGNSGIQFRSEPLPGGEVRGYQADIGSGWWGKLYEENGRGILSDRSGEQSVKLGEWNEYVIECVGDHVRTWINGEPCVDLTDPPGAKSGIIALQLHAGGATEVRFRNFMLGLAAPAAR